MSNELQNPNAPPRDPIYMVTMSAPTNIAVIKYWGKANIQLNTPINSSISVTLDQKDLRAVTTVAISKSFTTDRLWLNGIEEVNANTNKRFRSCIDGVKRLATKVTTKNVDGTSSNNDDNGSVSADEIRSMHVHVSSYNTFPTAAGLASSAAGYAALVATFANLVNAQESYEGELTTIARQGSGSACRSLYGGFVEWQHGGGGGEEENEIPTTTDYNLLNRNSIAKQIADEKHWPEIRSLILVVSDIKKDTSSTAGMSTSVTTSTLIRHRAYTVVPFRIEQMKEAWLKKDFTTFAKLTMQDSNQFHSICLDTYPPIFYINDVSRIIIRLVTVYNEFYSHFERDKDMIRVAYTFDAGPNAVLYLLEPYIVEVGALMLHYFPPFSSDTNMKDAVAQYLNNHVEYTEQIVSYQLNPGLLKACDSIGFAPSANQVKMMYLTQAGPGPQLVHDICNLDPITGLNIYTPS